MNILFVSLHFEENNFYYQAAKRLKKEGISPYFVSLSRKAVIDMRKLGQDAMSMPDLLKATMDSVNVSDGAVAEIEQKYYLISLRQVYLADGGLKEKSEAEKVQRTLNYFLAWEYYFDNQQIDCVVTDIGAELIRRTVLCVAKRRNIPCLFISCLPFPDGLTLSLNDFYEVERAIATKIRPLSDVQKNKVAEYIVTMKKTKPLIFTSPEKVSLERMKRFLIHSWVSLFIEGYSHEHFYKFQHAKRFLKRLMNKFLVRQLYQQPNLKEKYVYLPLHAHNDSQLTVKAPHCVDQRYIVNLCSNALPQGYKLYIKEHPGLIGSISFWTMREMLKNENVVLLPPTMSSHLLVENAQAVISINSSVGFEALLYLKPVIALGQSYYSGSGLTINVDNFLDLPKAIKQALNHKVDKEQLYSFIFAAMNTAYGGRPLGDVSEENINKVSRSILNRLKEIGITRQ